MPVQHPYTGKPSVSLSVDADIAAGTDLFGKSVTDLQENIEVGDTAITGTLKYVSGGWDSGTWSAEESTGNYIALHFESEADDATIVAEIVGGVHGPVTLDDDGLLIARITSTSQKIKVTVSAEGYETVTKTYALTDLVLGE